MSVKDPNTGIDHIHVVILEVYKWLTPCLSFKSCKGTILCCHVHTPRTMFVLCWPVHKGFSVTIVNIEVQLSLIVPLTLLVLKVWQTWLTHFCIQVWSTSQFNKSKFFLKNFVVSFLQICLYFEGTKVKSWNQLMGKKHFLTSKLF